MADIIEESGLSAGSIYSHFSGKQEILIATAGRALDEAQDILEATASADGHGISPRAPARLVLDTVMPRDMITVVLRFWAEAPNAPDLADLVGVNLGRIHRILADALLPWATELDEAGRAAAGSPAGSPGASRPDSDAAALAARAADQVIIVIHGYLIRTTLDGAVDPVRFEEAALALLPTGG